MQVGVRAGMTSQAPHKSHFKLALISLACCWIPLNAGGHPGAHDEPGAAEAECQRLQEQLHALLHQPNTIQGALDLYVFACWLQAARSF